VLVMAASATGEVGTARLDAIGRRRLDTGERAPSNALLERPYVGFNGFSWQGEGHQHDALGTTAEAFAAVNQFFDFQ